MMQKSLGKIFRKTIGVRYKNHRVVDDTIRAIGITNPNVIRNPS